MTSTSDSDHGGGEHKTSKKRIITGRLSDVGKRMKLSSHEMGSPCNCARLQCFSVISGADRFKILRDFSSMTLNNEQNAYLAGLITVIPVQKRRPRNDPDTAKFRTANFAYRVRIISDDSEIRDVPVCRKAFCSIHGITKNKIQYIQNNLKLTGKSPNDQRGKHSSMHRKLSDATLSLIMKHIRSFKGRASHYSLKDSKKIYLPAELNIKKMFRMFHDKHPSVEVSYETYRTIFNGKFNISFGYPRTDTCATCDEFTAKVKALNSEQDKEEIKKLTILNLLHKKKADTFYRRKKLARKKAKKDKKMEAICIDFAKNISLPNIATNDVYYKRQLSMYSFNVHVLSSAQSIFYVYHEGIAKKGPNEVASFIFHYITNFLDEDVEDLQIFCDSAGGQNKNYTIFRLISYLTANNIHGLKNIKITFPIRGHSYMECDKNVGLWNLQTPMETPEDFKKMIKSARVNPSPFFVVSVTKRIVKNWTKMLDGIYMKKCSFKIQPIREIEASDKNKRLLRHKAHYNGGMVSSLIRPKLSPSPGLKDGEFMLPGRLYNGPIRISAAKFKDIQSLLKFCRSDSCTFFRQLAHE